MLPDSNYASIDITGGMKCSGCNTWDTGNVIITSGFTTLRSRQNCRSLQITFLNSFCALQWRYNKRDGVSDHQPHDCLLNRLFIQAQIKENIKVPRHWPLCGEFTDDRWIPRTKGQERGKCVHLMTPSWYNKYCILIKSSLKFVANGPMKNKLALVQIMTWRRKATVHYLNQWWPCLLMHIYVTLFRGFKLDLGDIYISV